MTLLDDSMYSAVQSGDGTRSEVVTPRGEPHVAVGSKHLRWYRDGRHAAGNRAAGSMPTDTATNGRDGRPATSLVEQDLPFDVRPSDRSVYPRRCHEPPRMVDIRTTGMIPTV